MTLSNREKILRFYRGSEGEETAIRLVDAAEKAMKNQKFRLTSFLDPFGQEIAEVVAANFDGLQADFNGGYEGAERQRAVFRHEDFRGTPAWEIAVVAAAWKDAFTHISHRDVLGAVMGLGLERETIGDIQIQQGTARIVVVENMADFLLQNCVQLGAAHVQCSLDDLTSLAPREERCKEIRATVASLRVDSIAAAGFGMSRSRAASDIAAEKLKLNWQSVKNASQSVKEGDMLSMRGRGRLEVTEIRGQTKKGRISVLLHRYL